MIAPSQGVHVVLDRSFLPGNAAIMVPRTSDGRVMEVPKSGGTATQLAYYEASVQNLVVGASDVYWTTSSGDIIGTPIGGGPSTALVVGSASILGLAADATSVYWATYTYGDTGNVSTSSVKKIPQGGGAATTLWAGADTPEAIQVDDTSVYFTTQSGALLKVTPK